jgi:hypothetical protein
MMGPGHRYTADPYSPPSGRALFTMKKLEYQILEIKSSFWGGFDQSAITDQLNELGKLGWEVVTTASLTAAGTTTSLLVTLKRELPK